MAGPPCHPFAAYRGAAALAPPPALDSPHRARKQYLDMTFTFNEDAFKQVAQDAVRDMAGQQNRDLEALRKQYTGRPIDEIKPALQSLFAGYDGNITEPDLSDWAQLIHDGTRIEMQPEPIDWSH